MNRCTTLVATAALAVTTAANAQLIFGAGAPGNFYAPTTQQFTRYNNCFAVLPPGETQATITQVDLTYLIPATGAPAMNVELFATEMVFDGVTFLLGAQTSLGTFAIPASSGTAAFFTISATVPSLVLNLETVSNPGLGGFWIGWRQDNTSAAGTSGVMTAFPPVVGANYNFFGGYDHATDTFDLFQFGPPATAFSRFMVDVYGSVGGAGCDGPAPTQSESEICGNDENGGCNDTSNSTEAIPANAVVDGTYWADGGTRDTDWYEFTLTETSDVTLAVYSDGPILGFLVTADCPPAIIDVAGTACGSSINVPCLPAGTYRVVIALAVFNGFPCGGGSVNEYTFELASVPAPDCPEPCENPESCCFPHDTPGCSDSFCCETVCSFDPFCCIVAWDALCASQAQDFCFIECPSICEVSTNDCCVSNPTPGCADVECCEIVCGLDPFCCETAWDELCAAEAVDFCVGTCEPPPPLPNDECADAIEILDGATPFSTVGATDSGPALPPSCDEGFGLAFGSDIWFFYEATCDGVLTVSTCNTATYDTRLALYDACDGTLVACNDDGPGCAGFTSILTADVVCGQTYFLRVGGFAGAQGSGTLNVACAGDCGPSCESTGSADFNGSGCVDGSDLGVLLGLWGPGGGLSIADLNCDGIVDGADLGTLLGQWGCL